MKNELAGLKTNVDKLIKQAVNMERIENFLSLAKPENLEQAIRDFLQVDLSDDGQEYYRQDYPELLEALEKLGARRQRQQTRKTKSSKLS